MSNLVQIIRSTKHMVNRMAGGGGNDGAGPRNVNNFARIAIERGYMNAMLFYRTVNIRAIVHNNANTPESFTVDTDGFNKLLSDWWSTCGLFARMWYGDSIRASCFVWNGMRGGLHVRRICLKYTKCDALHFNISFGFFDMHRCLAGVPVNRSLERDIQTLHIIYWIVHIHCI